VYYLRMLEHFNIANCTLVSILLPAGITNGHLLICDCWFDNQSVQKSEVRQAEKDVVKSEVHSQTYSP